MGRIKSEGAALLALFALITAGLAAIYWPMVRDPSDLRFFGYGDCWTMYGPFSFYMDRSIHDGAFPLWNPLIFNGHPIAGNPQYLLFYPPQLIRSLLTFDPTPWRTHVGLAVLQYLHVVIAGVGTYALGRRLALSQLSAIGAALLYVFSAAFSQRIYGHLYIVYVASWWPWALLALHSMMAAANSRQRFQRALLLGIAYALAILSGHPQVTFLVGLSLAVYWLLLRVFQAQALWQSGDRRKEWLSWVGNDILFGAAAVGVAAALCAAMLGPTYQLNLYTPRGGANADVFESFSLDKGWNLLELLSFYTGSYDYEGIKTLSASGLLLVLVAFFGSRRKDLIPLAGLAAFLFIAAVEGSPAHSLIVWLIPFPYGLAPRTMIIAMLPLALLAGMGLETIRAGALAGRGRTIATAAVAIAALVVCITIARRLDGIYPDVSYEVLLFPIVTAGIAVGALWSGRVRWWVVALPLVLLAEAVLWRGTMIKQLSHAESMFASFPTAVVTGRPELWRGNSRASSVRPNTPLYRLEPEINGYDPLYLAGVAKLIYPNMKNNVFARGADAYSMAKTTEWTYFLLKRSFWLHKQYVSGELPEAGRRFPPVSTVYLADVGTLAVPRIEAGDVPDSMYSESIDHMTVTSRPKVFTPQSHPTADAPLVWQSTVAVPQQHKGLALYFESDGDATIDIITRDAYENAENRIVASFTVPSTHGELHRFDVPMPDLESMFLGMVVRFSEDATSVILERAELIVDRGDESEHIANIRRTANTTEVELRDLPGPRILSHIDFAFPGWHAYVDGNEVPLLRAFSYFKAVEVPAGSHTVRFEYRPTLVYVLIAVSALSWVAVLATLGWLSWPTRTPVPAIVSPRTKKSRR